MANTLSVMTNVLRNVVSKQRIRYKEKGFNLDLAYVCDNIIAMGYPAEKYESMYRNRLEDVYKFLEENHREHYKIYNLCLERSYDINKFHGRVSLYPFEDHNPPTIELIQNFCEDVDCWLKADVHNVAAVHCKAGKGRTGTMICCYLLYSGQQHTAEDALSCYDEKRTKDRKGVTIPSQRRYVQYFSKLIRLKLSYNRRTLQFCEIRFLEANALHSQGTVNCSISVLEDKVKPLQNFTIDFRKQCVLDVKMNVTGDIKVELSKNTKKLFHFWFNTFFVSDSAVIEGEGNEEKYVYTLCKSEIDDAHKDKEHKSFSEDFKVELVFCTEANGVGRDNLKVSSGNNLTNHRYTQHCATANARMPITQSNNYSLPQNNSSGSEMNFICDQKSSSSTSVSSSLGGATTDNSNGYECNSKRSATQQQRSGVQKFSNTHHSHPFVAMHDDNIALFTSPPPPPPPALKTATTPPGFIMDKDHLQSNNQHQHTSKVFHLQQTIVPPVTATSKPNQRHVQRQSPVGSGGESNGGSGRSGSLGGEAHATAVDVVCQTAANLNATSSNHSTNSSKANSVSSQSSSAIGDNEEDWESGESSAKQLDHITLLLSTSSVTTSPATTQLLPYKNTNTNISLKDSQKNSGNQSFTTSSLSSSIPSATPTSASHYTSTSTHPSTSQTSSKYPNKCNASNSSCTNRIAGSDDDDVDYADKVDKSKTKSKLLNSNIVVKQNHDPPKTMSMGNVNSKTLESNKGNNQIGSTVVAETKDSHKKVLALSSPTPPSTRPKLMHFLMAPKQSNASHQQSHKPIFKRKSSYKLIKSATNVADATHVSGDGNGEMSESAAAEMMAGGLGGGVAPTSKQKLKIKLKKNKLKFSQKFQWFQSYFRSNPVDFCENLVQQTTSIRRNSICSMASRTHKLSTTTPPSVTPPPTLAGVTADGSSSCEQLNDRVGRTVSVSESTSNASIATGDLCEDYYSYICDNQLSFSNSPCKSPRSMADIVSSSITGSGIGSSYGSSFARSAGSFQHQYLRERRETLPSSLNSHASRRNNVIIAKPARTNAIGFNINAGANADPLSQISRHDSAGRIDADASPASVYNTARCSASNDDNGEAPNKTTPFVFPHDPNTKVNNHSRGDASACDQSTLAVIPPSQTKYSLNLVIVKERSSEPNPIAGASTASGLKPLQNERDDNDSIIFCGHGQGVASSSHLRYSSAEEAVSSSAIDDMLDPKASSATCASMCSNSSSSGFCTSECCTTNSSSSSCNCNPFAVVLERHVALAASNIKQQHQDPKQTTIYEIVDEPTATVAITNEEQKSLNAIDSEVCDPGNCGQ
uniref:Phosphatidylinositol 3,4,5-trisphosphate 3-phosphatase and dual-specificity protein phosphatase PTEN n=1 Tax=Stomoxys calcitrans TaxID=35570 RepID=A0A1I8NP83_STOCA